MGLGHGSRSIGAATHSPLNNIPHGRSRRLGGQLTTVFGVAIHGCLYVAFDSFQQGRRRFVAGVWGEDFAGKSAGDSARSAGGTWPMLRMANSA